MTFQDHSYVNYNPTRMKNWIYNHSVYVCVYVYSFNTKASFHALADERNIQSVWGGKHWY